MVCACVWHCVGRTFRERIGCGMWVCPHNWNTWTDTSLCGKNNKSKMFKRSPKVDAHKKSTSNSEIEFRPNYNRRSLLQSNTDVVKGSVPSWSRLKIRKHTFVILGRGFSRVVLVNTTCFLLQICSLYTKFCRLCGSIRTIVAIDLKVHISTFGISCWLQLFHVFPVGPSNETVIVISVVRAQILPVLLPSQPRQQRTSASWPSFLLDRSLPPHSVG